MKVSVLTLMLAVAAQAAPNAEPTLLYGGLGYHGLPYASLPYAHAPVVPAFAPPPWWDSTRPWLEITET